MILSHNIRNSSCTRVRTCVLKVTWEIINKSTVHYHYSFKKHKSTLISITVKSHQLSTLLESRMFDPVVISSNISHQYSHIDGDKVCHHHLLVIMWTQMKMKFILLKEDAHFGNRLQQTGKINSATLKLFRDVEINMKILIQKTVQSGLYITIGRLGTIFSIDHLALVNLAQIEKSLQVLRDSIALTQQRDYKWKYLISLKFNLNFRILWFQKIS